MCCLSFFKKGLESFFKITSTHFELWRNYMSRKVWLTWNQGRNCWTRPKSLVRLKINDQPCSAAKYRSPKCFQNCGFFRMRILNVHKGYWKTGKKLHLWITQHGPVPVVARSIKKNSLPVGNAIKKEIKVIQEKKAEAFIHRSPCSHSTALVFFWP